MAAYNIGVRAMHAKRYQHCTAEAKAKRAVAAASVAKSLLGKLKATQG